MKCPSCDLEILTENHLCPLCGKSLSQTAGQNYADSAENLQRIEAFRYPIYRKKKRDTVKTVFFFVSCTTSIVCLFINYLTFSLHSYLWSFIVVSSIFFVYKTVFIWSSHIHYTGSKLFAQFFWSSQLFIVIDFLTGFSCWSLSLVIPWFSVGITLVLSILALCNRKNYQEYTGYMTAAFFLSGIPFVISLFPFIKVKWPSWTAVLYALLTIFALFLFSKRQFKAEMKKRFLL